MLSQEIKDIHIIEYMLEDDRRCWIYH